MLRKTSRKLLALLITTLGVDCALASTDSQEIRQQDVRPSYRLDMTLMPQQHQVTVRQEVQWTNPSSRPTRRLVFHVYPRHRPNPDTLETYRRTLESLRVDPQIAVDARGRRIEVHEVAINGTPLNFVFDEQTDTLMYVNLPNLIANGETVTVTLKYTLTIPPVQGRLGQYRGVTSLLNWYPVLAFYNGDGWDHTPYVAWHQPWLVEAANYQVQLRVPVGEVVVTSGQVVARSDDGQGMQCLEIEGWGVRDFAILCSRRFEVHDSEVLGVKVKVFSFPEHREHALLALRTAVESLKEFSAVFGPYPHPEFKVVESHFAWNGNESTGMIQIDHRVFETPRLASRYLEHLVTHETCHQWWYSTVGTDGFRETWMDEGLVTYLTEWRMEKKYGHDFRITHWPRGLRWLPEFRYQTMIHSGHYLYRVRGGKGVVLTPLPELEHLHNVFFLTYDRGSKVISMIYQRLGEEQFFEFLRTLYRRYQYRILRVADFQQELENFTGEPWGDFLDQWLRTSWITNWKIEGVWIDKHQDGFRTTVRVRQVGEIVEPVEIGYQSARDGPVVARLKLDPGRGNYQVGNAIVRQISSHQWCITFDSFEKPVQVVVDPAGRLLDADPRDNRWKRLPSVHLTPFYTPLHEVPLTQPLDRLSIIAGPGIDDQGRLVARGSLNSLHRYRFSPYLAFTPGPAENHLVAGVDSIMYNVPVPNVSLGAQYEHSLASDLFDDPDDQGKLFARWNRAYTTSFIYPNLSFVEAYFRFGDNFFPLEDIRPPRDDRIEDYRDIRAIGLSYHADSRLPYWNPDRGMALDATYEYGFQAFGDGETYHRAWGQVSAVHRLCHDEGLLGRSKLAGRLAGGLGAPSNGEHFRLGGSTRFRGQRSEDTEGSVFWLASAEFRYPVWEELNLDFYDHLVVLRSIYGSLFYDVGEALITGNSLGIDHAVGTGIYLDLPLMSFVENFAVRIEYGRSLRNNTSVLWAGWYYAL